MVSISTNNIENQDANPVFKRIYATLNELFQPEHLEVEDESHKHAGHAAMKDNVNRETHFKVTIVSERFQDCSIIDRHR